ncbi:hypothetical protein [Reinekea sp. G2M2-21]|uniref:hypothetical protein n=1 Tax=Reinekea sp. G2M2-21 TaxID=2788942 RepID=UPI0018A97B09|nr:hypothetical protein [Reinekea sp. G2M2-21]
MTLQQFLQPAFVPSSMIPVKQKMLESIEGSPIQSTYWAANILIDHCKTLPETECDYGYFVHQKLGNCFYYSASFPNSNHLVHVFLISDTDAKSWAIYQDGDIHFKKPLIESGH